MTRSAQFRRLYARHFRAVWSVVGQLGLHGAAREDAVQDVWVVAYRRLDTLDPRASARAWLCSIARRVVWRTRRTAARFDRRLGAFAVEPRAAPSDASARYEAVTTVTEALERLSEPQRRILVLTMVHGFSAPEVADALCLPVNTVYSRLRLARARIADFEERRHELERELRASDRPPQGLREHVLASIVPAAPLPWSLTASTSVKVLAVGALAMGVVAVAGVATTPAASAPEQVGSAAVASPPPPRDQPRTRPRPQVPADDGVAATPVAAGSSRLRPKLARSRPPESGVQPVAPGPLEPAPDEELDLEAELLASAQRSLRSEQPDVALRLLRQHELQFPSGRLSDVRDGAFVRALCAAGHPARARARVRELIAQRPDSPVATAVVDVCAPGDDGSTAPRR